MQKNGERKALSRTILVVAILLFLIIHADTAVAAVTDVRIEDELQNDAVRETLYINIADNKLSTIAFGLPVGAKDIVVNGKSTVAIEDTVNISMGCTTCEIILAYTLPNVVDTIDTDMFEFSRTLNLPQQPERIQYHIMLPMGHFISGNGKENDPPIVPEATVVKSDGKHIIIEWNEVQPTLPKRYFIRYSGQESIEDTGEEFFEEFGEWQVWVLIFTAFFIGIGLGVSLERFYSKKMESTLPFVPSSLLSPDEQTVVRALEKQSPIGQKDLGKQLNWSKSKVSAIMTNLEYKAMIKREKTGRNYKIYLIKEMGD